MLFVQNQRCKSRKMFGTKKRTIPNDKIDVLETFLDDRVGGDHFDLVILGSVPVQHRGPSRKYKELLVFVVSHAQVSAVRRV